RFGSWRGGRLVDRGFGNGRGAVVSAVGSFCGSLPGKRNCRSADFAAAIGTGGSCGVLIVVSHHGFVIFDAKRTTVASCVHRTDLPGGASVSHDARVACVFLVCDDFRVFCFGFWDFAAPYVQRETLLVPRNALRGNSIWAVCKPEP